MEIFTCVVDAVTLVESIHHIKKWIYNGYIRIHVPSCTFDRVEELYQASLVPKEIAPPPKRSSYKAARKEQPLFDINPRVAREFLLRAQSGKDDSKVTFQLPEEHFTQWKHEEEQALKVEQTPEERPTSFAQALLRKLNISEDNDASGSKGPAKPRLVARDSAVPKSPWKYHKVPTIASDGVPTHLKPMLSCLLWRLHEFENNPLMPQTFVLLTQDQATKDSALKLGCPIKSTTELSNFISSQQPSSDTKDTFGDLEREFSVKPRDHVIVQTPTETKDGATTNGCTSSDSNVVEGEKSASQPRMTGSAKEKVEQIDDVHANGIGNEPQNGELGGSRAAVEPVREQEQEQGVEKEVGAVKEQVSNSETSKDSTTWNHAELLGEVDGLAAELEMLAEGLKATTIDVPKQDGSTPSQVKLEPAVTEIVLKDPKAENLDITEQHITNGTVLASSVTANTEDETDDEEVVVFNPKSRRFSGQQAKPVESPRVSYIQALETGLPKKSTIQPKPANGPHQQTTQEISPATPPSNSTIDSNRGRGATKPQGKGVKHARHVTPTQQQVQSQVPLYIQYSPLNKAQYQKNQMAGQATLTNNDLLRAQDKNFNEAKSQSQGSEPSESSNSVQPQDSPMVRPRNQASTVHGHPSPRSVHHIDQVPPKARRQVQKQPTPYPTIIDPDAFDRSYAIAPPINTPEVNKRHSSGRASPRRTPRTPEPEVDYVLKSGSPRGATRGRGKLWVP